MRDYRFHSIPIIISNSKSFPITEYKKSDLSKSFPITEYKKSDLSVCGSFVDALKPYQELILQEIHPSRFSSLKKTTPVKKSTSKDSQAQENQAIHHHTPETTPPSQLHVRNLIYIHGHYMQYCNLPMLSCVISIEWALYRVL